MEKKTSILIRLTEEQARTIKQRALEKGISVNSYILSNIVKDEVKTDSVELNRSEMCIVRTRLSGREKELLEWKAQEADMTVSEFIRDIARKKYFVRLEVCIFDLNRMIDEINVLNRKLGGILSVLQSSGRVYEQDIRAIIHIFESVKDICKTVYIEQSECRHKLYEEAKRKLFEDMGENRIRTARSRQRKRNLK